MKHYLILLFLFSNTTIFSQIKEKQSFFDDILSDKIYYINKNSSLKNQLSDQIIKIISNKTIHSVDIFIEDKIELSKELIPKQATEKEAKGIVCLKTSNENRLAVLRKAGKIFVLSEWDGKNITVNKKDILYLLNYLSHINTDTISEKFYLKVNPDKIK